MLPTCFILHHFPLLIDLSALGEALLSHLGVCMSRAYGTSGFLHHLFSSKTNISTLYVLVWAIREKTVELDIKALFRNNLVITSAGRHP